MTDQEVEDLKLMRIGNTADALYKAEIIIAEAIASGFAVVLMADENGVDVLKLGKLPLKMVINDNSSSFKTKDAFRVELK